MSNEEFWRFNRELERVSQLRHDVADVLGRMVTELAMLGKNDPSCRGYYEAETRYWDAQRGEALKLMDQIVSMATRGQLPMTHALEGGRIVQIGNLNVTGDVVISTIEGSDNIVGKGVDQDVQERSS
jgi:hypothetical protein